MSAYASAAPDSALSSGESAKDLTSAIRFLTVDAILNAGEGHHVVQLGMPEVATALLARHLKFNPKNSL